MTWKEEVVAGLESIGAVLADAAASGAQPVTVTREDAFDLIEFNFKPAAPGTFEIGCAVAESGAHVSIEGWHEEFRSDTPPRDVFSLVAFALSDCCKLRVGLAGRFEYRWQLWALQDGEWKLHSEVSLLLYPWFLRRRWIELQNSALAGPKLRAASQVGGGAPPSVC